MEKFIDISKRNEAVTAHYLYCSLFCNRVLFLVDFLISRQFIFAYVALPLSLFPYKFTLWLMFVRSTSDHVSLCNGTICMPVTSKKTNTH